MHLAFLVVEAVAFWRTIINGELADNIVPLLDQLLWIIIIAELLFTVKVSFREHVLEPRPFLIVAVIAVSRRIIVLTAELSKLLKESEQFFNMPFGSSASLRYSPSRWSLRCVCYGRKSIKSRDDCA